MTTTVRIASSAVSARARHPTDPPTLHHRAGARIHELSDLRHLDDDVWRCHLANGPYHPGRQLEHCGPRSSRRCSRQRSGTGEPPAGRDPPDRRLGGQKPHGDPERADAGRVRRRTTTMTTTTSAGAGAQVLRTSRAPRTSTKSCAPISRLRAAEPTRDSDAGRTSHGELATSATSIPANTDEVPAHVQRAGCAVHGHLGVGSQRLAVPGRVRRLRHREGERQHVRPCPAGLGNRKELDHAAPDHPAGRRRRPRRKRSRSRRARCSAESTPLRIRSRAASRPTTTGRTRIRTSPSSGPTASTWISFRTYAAARAATSSETTETGGRSARTSRRVFASTVCSSTREVEGGDAPQRGANYGSCTTPGLHRAADEQQRRDPDQLVYRLRVRRVR